MIRVLVADDHAIVRVGLAQLLEACDDVEVVGSVTDGLEAVAAAIGRRPDVVLMDLSMPGVDGIEATRRILSVRPEIRIVMLTFHSSPDPILDAIDAGAVGYLLKDAEPDEILRGVRAAARGESPLDPKAARALLTARTEGSRAAELSSREREVLVLLGAGMANKQIARRLGISEKTVKSHLTNVYRHIGVSDRTQAAMWAQSHGLAEAPRES
jgi:DNA-binding NarL/FixJ family response regulator